MIAAAGAGDLIAFRPMEERDRHFVVSSWTQSFKASPMAGFIQAEDFYRIMDLQIEKALQRPDVRTIVAYNPNDTDHIADLHGFITADTEERPPLVYYVFVKAAYRRGGRGRLWEGPGLARRLFVAIGVDANKPFNYVCTTPTVRALQHKLPLAAWKPLWGRFPKHERRQGR